MKRLRKLSNNLILNIGEITANSNYLYRALENIEYGRMSYSVGEPLEIWKSNDDKNVLINGYHRLIEGILNGREQFDVVYVQYDEENKEYIDEYDPGVYDLLDGGSKYKGLEEFKNEQELDELSKKIKE